MTVKNMIKAAYDGNPSSFKEAFMSDTQTRLANALSTVKAGVVANMFSLTVKESTETKEDSE